MKYTKKVMLIVIGGSIFITCLAVLFLGVFASTDIDNRDPQKKAEMLRITLEWGRLAPIPESKSNFDIKTEGGSFSRSFRSNFTLPKADLEKWIHASPGLLDAEIEDTETPSKRYLIKPGGGANYAEAVIDFDKNSVDLYVSWS